MRMLNTHFAIAPWLSGLVLLVSLLGCSPDSDEGGAGGGSGAAPGKETVAPGAHGADTMAPLSSSAVPANRYAEDYPSLAALSNADVWVLCQEWDGRRDTLSLGLLTEWEQEDRQQLYTSPTHVFGTAMARGLDDVLHVVWAEQLGQGWALRELDVQAGATPGELGAVSAPRTLVAADSGNCSEPQLVSDEDGRLMLAWIAVHPGGLSLRAQAYVPGSGWGPAIDIASGSLDQWAPELINVEPGLFALAWDAALDGNFDIYLARLSVHESGASGPQVAIDSTQRVTDSPRYEAQPALAAAGDRLYLAYEVADEGWGREGSVNKLDEALHISRRLELVAIEGETLARLAVPFMEGVSKGLKDGCEQPQLQVDGNGNLVLFFRGLTLPDSLNNPDDSQFQQRVSQRNGAGVGWRTSIWFSFMSRFDGAQWLLEGVHQRAVPGSNGRGDAPIVLTRLKQGGTAYAVVGDARERQAVEAQGTEGEVFSLNWWEPISTESTLVITGRLRKGAAVGSIPLGPGRPMPEWPTAWGGATEHVTRELADGRSVELALGDLHRHSDLSRCSGNWDGPILEALRYGYAVGGLQFMAVTDHFEHMTRYDWWRSLAFMDLYDSPGRFVNFRAYERADAQTGHRNVISGSTILPMVAYRKEFLEGRDDARANSPDQLWRHFAGKDLLTIPHTPAGMYELSASVFDWLSFNPEYDRVVEIFQSYRGASEEFEGPRAIASSHPTRFARAALDGGLHFGFIASSDHQSTYGAFAGAWTTGLSRGEVFEALHSRRTFASTARMSLWADWDGVAMGEVQKTGPTESGRLSLEAQVFDREFALAELVVDGVVVETRELQGDRVELVFEGEALAVPATGAAYAYVRVRTTDGELGWTSPTRRGPDAKVPDGPLGVDAFDATTGPALQQPFKSSAQWGGGAPDGR